VNRKSGRPPPQNVVPARFDPVSDRSPAKDVEQGPAGRENYRDAVDLAALLRQLRAPPASPGFASRVLERATGAAIPPQKRLRPFMAASAAAIFFAFLLLSATIFDMLGLDSSPEPSASVVTVGDEVRTIRIAIDSARPIDDIRMTIALSDNLQLSGYRGQKKVSWNARLEQGVNVISLPVSAIDGGDGEITARIALRNAEKVFKIRTRYQPSAQTLDRYTRFVNAGCIAGWQCAG